MNQKQLLEKAVDHALEAPSRVVYVWVLSRSLGKLRMAETVMLLRELPLLWPQSLSYQDLFIRLQNGSEIRFALINEPDRYRGQRVSMAVVLLNGLVGLIEGEELVRRE